MKRITAIMLTALLLLSACSSKDVSGISWESTPPAADTNSSPQDSPRDDITSESAATQSDEMLSQTSAEEIYDMAKDAFGDYLSLGKAVENAKIKLYFNDIGECKADIPDGLKEPAEELISRVTLRSEYVEISLDSRFSGGVGVACAAADSVSEIPEKMPNSFNFADGVFDGDLSGIVTFPALKQGVSLAEYEYSNMAGCIAQLNEFAAAGAQAAASVLSAGGCFDEQYTRAYGTAHTVLCSDENGRWKINSDFNDEILTRECTEKIIEAFNEDKTLSSAPQFTVQLMFYMEGFVGVSANYSADEKYFATYDVPFWESRKAPYEESYHNKSFLCWSGMDGCLMGENGRLCPVGTFCIETAAPLGVYVPLTVMGDWKITRVGEKPFGEYAQEVSDGWCDYTQLVCKISESRLFLYGGDLSVSLYDIENKGDVYDILYHTSKHGELTVNADGTLTLTIRHGFTKNNMSLPLTLERYSPEIPDEYEYVPPQNEQLTASEYAARDTAEYGLLDLSGERVLGQDISSDPNVLSEYRRYVADGGAYTIEIYTVGASRLEYELASYDGSAGYQRSEITVYGGDDPIGWEAITINGGCYESYYKLDRYDMRKFEYRTSDYDPAPYVSLLCESEFGSRKFVKAYYITIGGIEYIAEEWNFDDVNNPITVYSIDGVIKGFEGNFHGNPVMNTVTRLEKQGDSRLICAPEKSTPATSHDYD